MISEDLYNKLHTKIYFGYDTEMISRVNVELNAHDIYRWMEHRADPDVLDWIAEQAKQLAKELREYNDDDFRSRA